MDKPVYVGSQIKEDLDERDYAAALYELRRQEHAHFPFHRMAFGEMDQAVAELQFGRMIYLALQDYEQQ